MDEWTIEFYETADGHVPVKEYIDGLQVRDVQRVFDEIDILRALGIRAGMPHVRPIRGTGLWELRIRGPVHHRIFYVAVQNRTLLLLHAFAKKTEKTPPREIAIAERYYADYLERHRQ